MSVHSPLSEGLSEDHSTAESSHINDAATPSTSRSVGFCTQRSRKKATPKLNADNILKKVDQQLDQAMHHQPEDEFDIIGRNVANKLRHLPKETAMIAEKLMMDILFEAQFGNIDRSTKLNLYSDQQYHAPTNTAVATTAPRYSTPLNTVPMNSATFFSNFSADGNFNYSVQDS